MGVEMEKHTYLRTHNLAAEHMLLDLGQVVTELHGESAAGQTRSGITLAKHGGMTIVLTHLHAGGKLQEHAAPGAATVQVLDGHIRLDLEGKTLDVPSGRLAVFDSGVRHSVEALEDSTLLLTLVGPQRQAPADRAAI
jgi:quercetin dioxygenase-like cupin family protein